MRMSKCELNCSGRCPNPCSFRYLDAHESSQVQGGRILSTSMEVTKVDIANAQARKEAIEALRAQVKVNMSGKPLPSLSREEVSIPTAQGTLHGFQPDHLNPPEAISRRIEDLRRLMNLGRFLERITMGLQQPKKKVVL